MQLSETLLGLLCHNEKVKLKGLLLKVNKQLLEAFSLRFTNCYFNLKGVDRLRDNNKFWCYGNSPPTTLNLSRQKTVHSIIKNNLLVLLYC